MEKKLAKEFNNKGFDLFKQSHYEEAITEFDKAIELNPKYKEAYYNKSLALFLLNKHEESISQINIALQINQKYAKALNLKGLILTSLNRYFEASMEYEKEFEPIGQDDGSYYFNKAVAKSNFDYAEAISNFKKAIEYNFDVEQSQKEIAELEKKMENLNQIDQEACHEKTKFSIEDQLRLYYLYTIKKVKNEHEKEKLNYDNEIKKLHEKISKLEDLFNDKLIQLIENKQNIFSNSEETGFTVPSHDRNELDNNFALDFNPDNLEEITLSPKLLKEHFSSQENFYCKICDNLILNISQCSKCETLYCKKCINSKLETNENCPNCFEVFESGNVPKITRNILNAFILECPFKCDASINYSNIFQHIKDCQNKGKVFVCRICNEKILVSKLNESNYEKLLLEHLDSCPEKNTECKFCHVQLMRKDLKLHVDSCDERNIKCEKCLFVYPFKMTLSSPHDQVHCDEIKKLRKNLEIFLKKNGI